MRELNAASLKDRDVELGPLSPDEIDQFSADLIELIGKPEGNKAMLFRVGNFIYVRSARGYSQKAASFFSGWVRGKHGNRVKPSRLSL